eukprot:gb/GECH01003170.1/.p1 GENE.gb/GECH01003170.1/~~gb/GECH01003170.1/.p1  ORF type:complete len:182 (+),score=55.33 gb/GECH01003170.1/:1-546(+)
MLGRSIKTNSRLTNTRNGFASRQQNTVSRFSNISAARDYSTKPLSGSKTHTNLKDAFSGESMANRRYEYFAQVADVEGFNDVAALFRSTAHGETGHAHGHMKFLQEVGDPATDKEFGDTESNLRSAVHGETHEYTDMYPGMARDAREEGFEEIANWFETLAMAEKSHAGRFEKALEDMKEE